MTQLTGKVAIVTGGSNGIVNEFLNAGAKVIVADIQDAGEGQPGVTFHHLDVTSDEQWQNLFEDVIKEFGKVDILVNNAGIGPINDIEHITLDDWHKVLAVDLDGVMLGTHYGVINMKEHGGSIINIASVGAHMPSAVTIAYGAAKAGVVMLSKDAAGYCHDHYYPVRVNIINPGVVGTPLLKKSMAPAVHEHMEKANLLGDPADIGKMATFLGSADAKFCNGCEYVVDGGLQVTNAQ